MAIFLQLLMIKIVLKMLATRTQGRIKIPRDLLKEEPIVISFYLFPFL